MTPRPARLSNSGALRTRAAPSASRSRCDRTCSLDDQVKADGATWLDRRLVERTETPLAHAGFGQEVREALSARIDHLSATGLAQRQGQRVDLCARSSRDAATSGTRRDRRQARRRNGAALPAENRRRQCRRNLPPKTEPRIRPFRHDRRRARLPTRALVAVARDETRQTYFRRHVAWRRRRLEFR